MTSNFAQFTTDLAYGDLPDAMLSVLRRSMLDTIGVAAIGSTTEMAAIACKVAPVLGAGKPRRRHGWRDDRR